MKYIVSLTLIIFISSCMPPEPQKLGRPNIDWSNVDQQEILDLRDERRSDLLKTYLADPIYEKRYLAAASFGSIIDTSALDQLYQLLISDPSSDIREQAAFAMGQSKSGAAESLLVDAFINQDTSDTNTTVRMAILEAVGKVGSEESLNNIASVKSYQSSDDKLLLGQARAIYQFGLRGILSEIGTKRMVDMVGNQESPIDARVMAANYLYRTKNLDLSNHLTELSNALLQSNDPKIRMALIVPLARSKDQTILPNIWKALDNENDYRVKINGIRGLANFPYRMYRDSIINYLSDGNKSVELTTSELIKSQADPADVRPLLELVKGDYSHAVKANLYAAVTRSIPHFYNNTRKQSIETLTVALKNCESIYDKSRYIEALSFDPTTYPLIYKEAIQSGDNFLVTAGIFSLKNVLTSDKFNNTFKTVSARKNVRTEIISYLMGVFKTDNVGAMAASANLLRDPDLNLKDEILVKEPIRSAIRSLEVPRELETKMELQQTLAYLEGKEYQKEEIEYNHPINWETINSLSDSSRVYIVTSQGQVELELYPDTAPGSVANFIDLVNADYYDLNVFHRVVPNFVIQAGCTRGDGYGSMDYTIRSEFSTHYYEQAGYIGMASAGPDTESSQWFITHSPTPHLDGRYTIFGKVIKGIEVIHAIQQGDIIQDIRVFKG